jgi:FMN phosphatase YigB (HAD superfamily)
VLERLDVPPALAAMVGDSIADDIEGAEALGMRALLLDREGRYPDRGGRLTDLRQLPAALGLIA